MPCDHRGHGGSCEGEGSRETAIAPVAGNWCKSGEFELAALRTMMAGIEEQQESRIHPVERESAATQLRIRAVLNSPLPGQLQNAMDRAQSRPERG